MTVKFIREQKSGRITVGVEDDAQMRTYSISARQYASMRFVVGGELDENELRQLILFDEEYRATKKALSLLSYSDKNAKTLYLRLLNEGFSREVARGAVNYCLEHGYINEKKQLERIVSSEANHALHGPRYIRDKLAAKGYSRTDIDSTLDALIDSGEIDFDLIFGVLCEKKGATTPEERKALAYKYGFK